MLFSLKPSKAATAKLLGVGKEPRLLASFQASTPPVLWHYAPQKLESATICVQEKEGEWELGVQTGGHFAAVAHFDERSDADAAFAVVRKTLMKSSFFPALGPALRLSLVFLALLIGLFLWVPSSKELNTSAQATKTTAATQDAAANALAQKEEVFQKPIVNGRPMTADDVLTPPAD